MNLYLLLLFFLLLLQLLIGRVYKLAECLRSLFSARMRARASTRPLQARACQRRNKTDTELKQTPI
ncbi:MAG: hypothetical protein K0M45_11990 [Candidatus Paracaedibacteraceae bacterium]|nr:hypothetical protein [Candidatus Paracaedibacteraceae bacterium]